MWDIQRNLSESSLIEKMVFIRNRSRNHSSCSISSSSSSGSFVPGIEHSDSESDDGSLRDQLLSPSVGDQSRPSCKPYVGFLSQLMIATLVIGGNALLLFGTLFRPQIIGLYIVLPYYICITLISSPQREFGWAWKRFSQNFSVLVILRKFLGIRLVINETLATAQSKDKAQFVFAVFPHGANADYSGVINGMLYDSLPNIAARTRTLVASVLFRIPMVREISLWMGCVDARRDVADKLLEMNYSLVVLPGGQVEQIKTTHGRERIFLKRRKGFIRLALRHGVPVVPVYAFGVSDYYHTSHFAMGFRLWLLKRLGISIPIARGQYGTLISPKPVPTTVVFGEPIHFSIMKPGSPTPEEIEMAHAIYCEGLVDLFDSHKAALGYGDRILEIE